MSTTMFSRCRNTFKNDVRITPRRWSSSLPSTSQATQGENTAGKSYYKITLLRSAIALGSKKKGTLESLGIHRRMQTVYHPHAPEFAGKILAVKELVKVENVSQDAVRTKTEQRRERRPSRGFSIVQRLQGRADDVP